MTAVDNSRNRPPSRSPAPVSRHTRIASRGVRFGAVCGIVGPALFTAAWVVSSLRQRGHPAAQVQLSGLAAIDAHDPQIMMAGFVGLGACSVVFGATLRHVLAGAAAHTAGGAARTAGTRTAGTRTAGTRGAGAGPWLIMIAGAAAIAAGLLRRDHMLLVGPGFAGESWHNQAHDIVSGIAYTTMIAGPIALAQRLRTESDWAVVCPVLLALALVSAGALVLFASRVVEPWNGVVQRIAVTLPLASEVVIAGRMLTLSGDPSRPLPAAEGRRAPGPGG